MEQKPSPYHQFKLPAAVLSGSLLLANTAMGASAIAEPLPPGPPAAAVPSETAAPAEKPDLPAVDVEAVKQYLAKQVAAHAAKLQASHPAVVTDANNAFTPTWRRCVIIPESSGRAHITSGLYGILVSTWHAYGRSGVPGDYSPAEQAEVALKIYHDNNGFGPGAWNNSANCGKDG